MSFCPVDAQTSATVESSLFVVLNALPDPRRTGWRCHPLGYVLAVTFTAFMLPGFESLASAAQWAAHPARTQLKALAIGGNCARGARRRDGSMPQVMSAVTHDLPVMVAPWRIPDKTSEIRRVTTPLEDLTAVGWDLASIVVTLDAPHAVRDTATRFRTARAHYSAFASELT